MEVIINKKECIFISTIKFTFWWSKELIKVQNKKLLNYDKSFLSNHIQ
jgi:hypothetical protein